MGKYFWVQESQPQSIGPRLIGEFEELAEERDELASSYRRCAELSREQITILRGLD